MFANLWKLIRRNPEAPSERERGAKGEDLAASLLKRRGMRLLERNWRCASGEIDIIGREEDIIVIVEVKSAGRETSFRPEDRVNHTKRDKLRRLAAIYMKSRRLDLPVRYDVVTIVWDEGEPRVVHYEDAFA